jgi:hypothetical protein
MIWRSGKPKRLETWNDWNNRNCDNNDRRTNRLAEFAPRGKEKKHAASNSLPIISILAA